ncbi:uncharacterized protein LOC128714672 [Anopheles marshallii]|uniref:uncharacterized protein LOC128714672 n=1 Tax=Anopheles marshallii TaxID=1521116 RepID=UPI00237A5BD3|nr:uncharacterized protein LOC128714672 [Anopheles marshallii]
MKCILSLLSALSVALVVAIPANFHYGGGGGYNINGTSQSFNFSGDSNSSSSLPDFGQFLPNLTQPSNGFGFPQFALPSSWNNFTDAISSIFPGFGGGFPFFGNGQNGGFFG